MRNLLIRKYQHLLFLHFGKIQLNVGKSSYIIDTDTATDVLVDEQTVEQVEDTNFEAYESLDDSIEVSIPEDDVPIESGIIKELAKTLLVGGIVRLSAGVLKNNL